MVWSDQHSLKYLVEQKVTLTIELKGLTKMIGLDYEVKYRVFDALYRQQEVPDSLDDRATGNLMVISSCTRTRVQEIIRRYEKHAHFVHSCTSCTRLSWTQSMEIQGWYTKKQGQSICRIS